MNDPLKNKKLNIVHTMNVIKNSLELPYIEQQINEKEGYVINTYIV
tara:strand:- start:158 stop:295 length:138 start_codon:yes stop_codon:yes gene_type:complete